MILHTILPKELIFQGVEETGLKQQIMMRYNGIPVLVEPISESEYYISQILSTDPNHFLQPGCFPGKVISLWDNLAPDTNY